MQIGNGILKFNFKYKLWIDEAFFRCIFINIEIKYILAMDVLWDKQYTINKYYSNKSYLQGAGTKKLKITDMRFESCPVRDSLVFYTNDIRVIRNLLQCIVKLIS